MAKKQSLAAVASIATSTAEYRDVLKVRAAAYAEHLETMAVDPALKSWAQRMADRHKSPTVKVWHNTLPWLEALLVVRYGEAVDGVDAKGKPIKHWPKATTVADYGRAMDWESGKEIPEGVRVAHTLKLEG
jgi:hypothetical protein